MTDAPDPPGRRQLIQAALARRPEAVAEATIELWELLAPTLITIIGEGGFKPLYCRSVRLASKRFPWLSPDAVILSHWDGFSELQSRLSERPDAEATLASEALFNFFFDLLASLIGEDLATHFLRRAWPPGDSELPEKELPR
jgi:hypothetical protein